MDQYSLPQELDSVIGSEGRDFAVMAKHTQPIRKSLSLIVVGVSWTALIGFTSWGFFNPLLKGGEVHFKTNGVLTSASLNNFGPAIMPAAFSAVFVLVGIGLIGFGLYLSLKKGGYFVGTPTRLIHFRNKNVRSVDWEQFSGDIEVRNRGLSGDLSLQLRTGRMVRRKNGPDRYVPDVIYLSGIPNVLEVESSCRKRIKENDPTPSTGRGVV